MTQAEFYTSTFNGFNIYVDLLTNGLTVDDIAYRPLVGVTSQQTRKPQYVIAGGADYTQIDRYIKLIFIISSSLSIPAGGFVTAGTTDYPLGLYDVTIYNNSSHSNLDPAGLTILYYGLMNVYPANNASSSSYYTKYTTNDTDTDSIYVTA